MQSISEAPLWRLLAGAGSKSTIISLTTPGVWSSHYGFPALGAAVYTLGEALSKTSFAKGLPHVA
jgi:hypothetical protein